MSSLRESSGVRQEKTLVLAASSQFFCLNRNTSVFVAAPASSLAFHSGWSGPSNGLLKSHPRFQHNGQQTARKLRPSSILRLRCFVGESRFQPASMCQQLLHNCRGHKWISPGPVCGYSSSACVPQIIQKSSCLPARSRVDVSKRKNACRSTNWTHLATSFLEVWYLGLRSLR
jgi:hypothetical protein